MFFRSIGFALSVGSLLSLTVADALGRPKQRDVSQQGIAIERAAHPRHISAKKFRKAIRRHHRNTVHAKTGRRFRVDQAELKVFDSGKPALRLGVPYRIGGRLYTPRAEPNYRAEGRASWYGPSFHGRRTANGERFDMDALSAAHPTLPLPSYVRVTNLENNRSLVLRLNDRGPFHGRRLIDVSVRAAKLLGFYEQGLARVRVEYVGRSATVTPDLDRTGLPLQPAVPTTVVMMASLRLRAYDPDLPTEGQIRWY